MSGEEYTHYLIPINVLMGFGSYQACTNWVRSKWGTGAGQNLMYEQGWAFTYFLNHYKNGKYKENWLKYFDAVLKRQVSRQTMLPVFKRAFGIKYEDEWDELQSEWETYFKDVILPMSKDLSKWQYKPPSTDDDWLPEEKD